MGGKGFIDIFFDCVPCFWALSVKYLGSCIHELLAGSNPSILFFVGVD